MLSLPGEVGQAHLEQALTALATRHDMLRCAFERTQAEPPTKNHDEIRQRYYGNDEQMMAPLRTVNVAAMDAHSLHEQLNQWQSGFDIYQGPLWQVAYLTGYADGTTRLFFCFHHLIIDAVSWRIIAEDMRLLLTGETLPAKTSSYRQWAQAVQAYAQRHENDVDYWLDVLAGAKQTTSVDGNGGCVPTTHEADVGLSTALTAQLLHRANEGYHTEINDLLLSALSRALSVTFAGSLSAGDSQLITLEGHGREIIDETLDVSQTLGWFTTTYPVKLHACDDLSELIIQTKEMIRGIPDKGIGFGALTQGRIIEGDSLTQSQL